MIKQGITCLFRFNKTKQSKSSFNTVSQTKFGTQPEAPPTSQYAGRQMIFGVGVGAYSRVGAYKLFRLSGWLLI